MNVKLLGVASVAAGVAGAVALARFLQAQNDTADGEPIDAWTVKHLKTFIERLAEARESTIAAFSATDGSEHEKLDASAADAIARLGTMLAEIRPGMSANAAALASSIVDRYEAAQVQLMSFAINRKNREPGGAQSSMEEDDRRTFERESAELAERLRDAVAKRRA